jgi:putative membrane protein
MLIALPHPELWANTRLGDWAFSAGMRHGGVLHMVLGAAAMFAFGASVLGWRRTMVFLVAAVTISLGAELVGTGTGWPFGNYAYADGLGTKIFGRVPFTIPLSWFYLGLASYLLACGHARSDTRPASVIALGVWFMVVWDLVLDPAMAHPAMPIRFWIWHQAGAYFGMPLQNFAGWALTAATFMTVSRLLWGRDVPADRLRVGFPLAVYALNMGFAIALAASVGLWAPVLLAVTLGLVPALAASRGPQHEALARMAMGT